VPDLPVIHTKLKNFTAQPVLRDGTVLFAFPGIYPTLTILWLLLTWHTCTFYFPGWRPTAIIFFHL
jgi:hypothetical protein